MLILTFVQDCKWAMDRDLAPSGWRSPFSMSIGWFTSLGGWRAPPQVEELKSNEWGKYGGWEVEQLQLGCCCIMLEYERSWAKNQTPSSVRLTGGVGVLLEISQKEPGTEPLLLHIERSQLSWFSHLCWMPPRWSVLAHREEALGKTHDTAGNMSYGWRPSKTRGHFCRGWGSGHLYSDYSPQYGRKKMV